MILALLIVNIVLTAIMMFSVTSTNQKTADLVGDIASAISLDIQGVGGGAASVSLENTETYTIADMQIALKKSVDENGVPVEEDHFAKISVVISMDKTHEDYATYSGQISGYDTMISDAVSQTVSNYTEEECRASFTSDIRNEMLTSIQNLFQSKVVYGITLSNIKYGG